MKSQAQPYQPLTSENAALVLVDHQVGLMTGVRDYSTGELKHNVVALAKAAKALKLPIVVTTTARDSMWGPTFPELVEALPGIQIIDRSTVNAWDDPKVAAAIEATGRKKLIIAGISLEVCAAFPAITAIGKGYDAYVAVDASGTFSDTKREAGLLRMQQAGVIVSDYATLMVEILKDNARPEAAAVYGALDMPWATLVGQISKPALTGVPALIWPPFDWRKRSASGNCLVRSPLKTEMRGKVSSQDLRRAPDSVMRSPGSHWPPFLSMIRHDATLESSAVMSTLVRPILRPYPFLRSDGRTS